MHSNYYADDLDHDIVGTVPHDVYYLAPQPVDPNSLYIQVNRAGIVLRTPEDFLITRDDTYPYSMIHCVLYGKGTVFVRGRTFSVHDRQLFVISSNEGHIYSSDPEDPLGLVWLEYAGSNSAQLTRHILDLGDPIFEGSVFTDVLNMCTSLFYQPRQEGPGISQLLYSILMTLCKHVESEGSGKLVNHKIVKYIDEHIDQRLTLTEVAQTFGYHPAYFSSLFSQTMGITFSRYVMDRKINHACFLLETTSWPVERIAQELSFFDASHFIQRFKSARHMTPVAYRNASLVYQKRHGGKALRIM